MHELRGFILALHLFGVIFWLGGLLMIASLLARVPDEVGLPKERFLGAARGLFEVGTNIGAALTIGLGAIPIVMQPEGPRPACCDAKLFFCRLGLFFPL